MGFFSDIIRDSRRASPATTDGAKPAGDQAPHGIDRVPKTQVIAEVPGDSPTIIDDNGDINTSPMDATTEPALDTVRSRLHDHVASPVKTPAPDTRPTAATLPNSVSEHGDVERVNEALVVGRHADARPDNSGPLRLQTHNGFSVDEGSAPDPRGENIRTDNRSEAETLQGSPIPVEASSQARADSAAGYQGDREAGVPARPITQPDEERAGRPMPHTGVHRSDYAHSDVASEYQTPQTPAQPSVHIGHIDVIVHAPEPVTPPPAGSPLNLASRRYLRGL